MGFNKKSSAPESRAVTISSSPALSDRIIFLVDRALFNSINSENSFSMGFCQDEISKSKRAGFCFRTASMTLERPNTNLTSKVPLLRASPIIGANVLELWTIIIRLRMVWILPGNKETEAGGAKVVGRLGSATDTGPSFPGKVNYMPYRSFRLDRCRCDRPIRQIPE